MHYVVTAQDKPDALPRRTEVIAEHRAYLAEAPAQHGVTVLLSGPLVEDAGAPMRGSFFLLEAPDRAVIETMFAQDPLVKADVWGEVMISAVSIRQNNMGAS